MKKRLWCCLLFMPCSKPRISFSFVFFFLFRINATQLYWNPNTDFSRLANGPGSILIKIKDETKWRLGGKAVLYIYRTRSRATSYHKYSTYCWSSSDTQKRGDSSIGSHRQVTYFLSFCVRFSKKAYSIMTLARFHRNVLFLYYYPLQWNVGTYISFSEI